MLLIQIQKIEAGKPLEKLGELHIINTKNVNFKGEDWYSAEYWEKENKQDTGLWHHKKNGFLKLTRDIINELLKQST